MGLGAIFDHGNPMLGTYFQDFMDTCQAAIQMRDDDRARQHILQMGRAHIGSFRLDIDKYRPGMACKNSAAAIHGGIGDHANTISRLDPHRFERKLQSIRTIGNTDAMWRAAVTGKFSFELRHAWLKDVVTAFYYLPGAARKHVFQGAIWR